MRACLEVDIKALKENIRILSSFFGGKCFFCPMIKANGYGHGARTLAKIIQSIGFKKLGVISVEEALELKSVSKNLEIYIFGPFCSNQVDVIGENNFIPVVGQWEELKSLGQYSKKEISFHIKINLGMNRLGFSLQEVSALMDYIQNTPRLKLKGVASHLHEGETAGMEEKQNIEGIKFTFSKHQETALEREKNHTGQKINQFKSVCDKFKTCFPGNGLQFHLLNSAGGWAVWSHSLEDSYLGFRPGICLYGIKPKVCFYSEEAKKKYHSVKLKPVSQLKAFVVQSRVLSPGQSVSYGKTWTARRKTVVAVVSMGYADGFPYQLSNKTEVLFRGKKVPVIGRVCMDFFMIDVTALKGSEICKGEEVVIFGSQEKHFISVEEQAEKASSIPYEILTGLGSRVRRIYV